MFFTKFYLFRINAIHSFKCLVSRPALFISFHINRHLALFPSWMLWAMLQWTTLHTPSRTCTIWWDAWQQNCKGLQSLCMSWYCQCLPRNGSVNDLGWWLDRRGGKLRNKENSFVLCWETLKTFEYFMGRRAIIGKRKQLKGKANIKIEAASLWSLLAASRPLWKEKWLGAP